MGEVAGEQGEAFTEQLSPLIHLAYRYPALFSALFSVLLPAWIWVADMPQSTLSQGWGSYIVSQPKLDPASNVSSTRSLILHGVYVHEPGRRSTTPKSHGVVCPCVVGRLSSGAAC